VGAERTVRPSGRRGVLVAAGAFGLVAVAAVAFAATGVGTAPAYAVEVKDDGLVEVSFSQVAGVDGANERLAELGVRARAVAADPNCASAQGGETVLIGGPGVPAEMAGSRFLIQPGSIPAGSTLMLVIEQVDPDRIATTTFEVTGQVPTCVPSTR